MQLKFGQFFTKTFNFFEKIGGFFLRSNVLRLRVVVILALIITAWQFGVMSISSVTSRADDPKECNYAGVKPGDCDCNSSIKTACYPVQWFHSCDNGKEFSYNERVSGGVCAEACGGVSECKPAATGKSCGDTPDGGMVRKEGCTWDGTHSQCVMKVVGCTDGTENPYYVNEAGCEGQCAGRTATKRSAEQVCQQMGGAPDGECMDKGQACRIGPSGSAKQCCYGDESDSKRNGTCYKGSTPQVTCSGNTITNNSGHAISVMRFSGANSCPMRNQTGSSFTLADGASVDATCEQLDASGFCGVCSANCGDKTPPHPGKHKECVNNTCALVNGAGADNCPNNCQQQSAVCDQLSASPTSGNTPLTVNFNLSGHTNNGGSIQKYRFDFSDTTSTGEQGGNTSSHTYNSAGTFTARGYVTDNKGNVAGGNNSCLVTISTNERPTYKHKFCKNNACVERDCPDKYTSCGNSCGKDQDCQPGNQFSVCDSLGVSPNSSNSVPITVTANLSGHTVNGGSITGYRFNFGDNSGDMNQSGNSLQHTYTAKGTYYINGYVIDDKGNVSGGCQAAVNIYQPQILGSYTPPVMPKTGPETDAAIALSALAAAGWLLRGAKFSWKLPKFK